MPQFINSPYSSNSDGGIGSMLSSMGQAQFGDTARRALLTQEMLKAQRLNQAAQAEADAYRTGNMSEMGAQGILGGRSAADVSGMNLLHESQVAPNVDAGPLQRAQIGHGEGIASTATGQGRVIANEAGMNNARIAEQRYQFENTPHSVMGSDENPVIATNKTAIGQRPPMTQVDIDRALFGPAAPQAAPAPSAPPPAAPAAPQQPAAPLQPTAPVQYLTPDSAASDFSPASIPPQTGTPPQPVPAPTPPAPQTAAPTAPPTTPGGETPKNDAALQGMSPAAVAMVKALVEGKELPGRGSGINPSTMQRLKMKAFEYDPSFDETLYPVRVATRRAFASGPQGNAVRSFDVGLSHLTLLDHLGDALKNGDYPAINALNNVFQTQFGHSAPTSFAAAKSIVGDEITKAVIGANGALGDRQSAQATLSMANSPEQLKQVIQTYKNLMTGQLQGLKTQYESGTKLHDFTSHLQPETVHELLGGPPMTGAASGPGLRTATNPQTGEKITEPSPGAWGP